MTKNTFEKINNLQRQLDTVIADRQSLENRYNHSLKENQGLQRRLENAYRTIVDLEKRLRKTN